MRTGDAPPGAEGGRAQQEIAVHRLDGVVDGRQLERAADGGVAPRRDHQAEADAGHDERAAHDGGEGPVPEGCAEGEEAGDLGGGGGVN